MNPNLNAEENYINKDAFQKDVYAAHWPYRGVGGGVWQVGLHGRGACMAGGMRGGECMAGGVHGKGVCGEHAWQGHAW